MPSEELIEPLMDTDLDWDLQPLPCMPEDGDLMTEVLIESEAYRAIAQAAIHALRDLTQRFRRQREQYYRLLEERRARRSRGAA